MLRAGNGVQIGNQFFGIFRENENLALLVGFLCVFRTIAYHGRQLSPHRHIKHVHTRNIGPRSGGWL